MTATENPGTAQATTAARAAQSVGGAAPLGRGGLLCIDLLERAAILALYAWLVARIVARYQADGNVFNLILLASEGLVVFFVLIRRVGSAVSLRPAHWLIAFAATVAPLLVWPDPTHALLPPVAAAVVMLIGILVQLHAKLVLARSFGCVPANRGLKFAGPYQFVRHPMYLGYLVTHLAFLAMNPTLWNLMAVTLCYSLQVPRLLVEERFLSQDPKYQDYAARVRYRLIPGLF